MLALFREGFWKDALALVIAAVVAGAFAAGGTARGIEAYFTRAVAGLVGAPGEYDAIVHLKQEAGAEALQALADRLDVRYPGYFLKEGPELAGYFNVLVRLPASHRTRAGFESLASTLEDIPGYDGITYIVEPAVVIKDVHPALQPDFVRRAEAERGVGFSFASGSSVWVVLDSADDVPRVQRALEAFAASLAVLDLRLPVATASEARDALAQELIARLEAKEPGLRLTPVQPEVREGSPEADLVAARRVIEALSELDAPLLRARLFEAADLIEGAFAGSLTGGSNPSDLTSSSDRSDQRDHVDLAYVLDAFRRAVDELELLETRLLEVTERLRGAAAQGEASDVLIALLVQKLIERLGGEGPVAPPQPAVDARELRAGIEALAERLRAWEELNPAQIAASLRELAASLPSVDPETGRRIAAVLDALVHAGETAGDRVLILARNVTDQDLLRSEGAAVLGDSAALYVQQGGVVQPDARTAVLQLLTGARRVVTLLVALLAFAIVFLFDVTALLSFARRAAEVNGESRARATVEASAWGGLVGAVVLGATVWLALGVEGAGGAAAALPAAGALAGALLGALLALACDRLGPVDPNQYLSALSLGIAAPDILREVIIPAGRPGLLYWLTRPGRNFGRQALPARAGRLARLARIVRLAGA